MGTYFDINGTAMIYINTNPSIRTAKTKKEADNAIEKHCQQFITIFKNKLQELTKQNRDVFDEISFEGFSHIVIRLSRNNAYWLDCSLNSCSNASISNCRCSL